MLNLYNNCSDCKNRSICKYYGVTDRAEKLLKKVTEEDSDVKVLNIRISCDKYVKECVDNGFNDIFKNSYTCR